MSKIFRLFFLSLFFISLFGCAGMDRLNSNEKEYFSNVKDYTDRAEFYEGFMNVFQMQGTILNAKVYNGQVTKKADSFNWTDVQKNEEQSKVDASLRSEAKVFLSFFSPENKVNNLDSPSTIWRVFLDVNNKRYVGSVSTYVGFQNEARLFYPYHSVFAKAYMVKFPVPMINIQDYPATLTVTGTIGSDTLKFKALK
jgi:hypothetical protein